MGRAIEDLALVLGLGIVGYIAYNEWYKGKGIDEVFTDVDTKLRGFLDSITSQLPALPAIPQPQFQFPQIPQAVAQTPPALGNIQDSSPTNTVSGETDPKTTESSNKPKGSGQLPNNPMVTPPPAGSGGAIVAFAGDWDSNNKSQQTAQIIEKQNCSKIIGVGDYSYSSEKAADWFTKIVGPQWKGKMVGCYGNHDTHDSGGFLSTFGMSNWNQAIKVAPNLAVVFINTQGGIDAATLDKLTIQAKGMGAKHIAYCFHKPYITSKNGHHQPSENKWSSIIDAAAKKHGVKLLVAGHNHLYEHFKCGEQHYVTSGAAGRKFYAGNCQACGTTKCVENTNGFLKVSVGASLLCQFISNSGSILDTFTIP